MTSPPQNSLMAIPDHYQTWLLDTASLSKKLRAFTQNTIQHHLENANWSYPNVDECLALGLKPNDVTWVREIIWNHQKKPWICARVVIPKSAIEKKAELKALISLQDHSLGDVLYQDPHLQREVFGVEELTANHPYTLWAGDLLNTKLIDKPLWMRHSIFHYYQQALLVTEIFLDDFLASIKPNSLHE